MYPDSRQTIHMGINFILAPFPVIDRKSKRRFDEALESQGIDFTDIKLQEQQPELVVIREPPPRLEIKIAPVGPPGIGQFLIISPSQTGTDLQFELFVREAEAVVRAFENTWAAPNRQIVNRDVSFRDLYETSAQHAFAELWETILGQPPDKLKIFGRSVLGGGLRFVMPPTAEAEPLIELKIESFLKDTRKIFVETQFVWTTPLPAGTPMNPKNHLEQVDKFIETEILSFIMGRTNNA